MRTKIISSFLFIIGTLTMCNSKGESTTISESQISIDYDSFNDRHIDWEYIFNQNSNCMIYVYSKTCKHCNQIKSSILDFATKNESLYFVEFNKEIPVNNFIEDTIGKTDYKDVFIMGTPTLIVIENSSIKDNIPGSERIIKYIENITYYSLSLFSLCK